MASKILSIHIRKLNQTIDALSRAEIEIIDYIVE